MKGDHSELNLVLYPSIAEIENATPDLYMGGLDDFHKSVRELRRQLSRFVILDEDDNSTVANYEPASILQVGIGAGLCAAATAVYNVLKAWACLQNGRKIKVRFGPCREWQIETTQLSVDQFLQLVNALNIERFHSAAAINAKAARKAEMDSSREQFWAQVEQMRTSFAEQGVEVIGTYSDEAEKEAHAVHRASKKKRDDVRNACQEPGIDERQR